MHYNTSVLVLWYMSTKKDYSFPPLAIHLPAIQKLAVMASELPCPFESVTVTEEYLPPWNVNG